MTEPGTVEHAERLQEAALEALEIVERSHAAMLAALKRWEREEYDAESWPAEPTCQQCTGGITPHTLDRGPCLYHEIMNAIEGAS